MKYQAVAALGLALLDGAAAFPSYLENEVAKLAAEGQIEDLGKRQLPGTTFNAKEQYVSTSGVHKFVPPGPGDQRGPCPGLNALANHGYLPHNGIGTITDFIEGTYAGFGMGRDLGGFLGVYGAIFDGNLEAYSIGFASKQLPSISGLLGTPQGLGGSHNKYENDGSPMRGDLYTYGNSYKTQISQFEEFYAYHAKEPLSQQNYDIDDINKFRVSRFKNSISTNPYFFNGPFSGFIATVAAYSFMFRFMANKSAEYPEGRLDGNILKTFYSISGSPGNFKYKPGYERFPENWYKRPLLSPYNIPFFAEDAAKQFVTYPDFFSLGGNTGKVNSFAGLEPANVSNGIYNFKNLGKGNNAACYAFELTLQAAPDLLEGIFTDVTEAENMFSSAIQNATKGLGCRKLEKLQYNQYVKQYPGYTKSYDGYKGL